MDKTVDDFNSNSNMINQKFNEAANEEHNSKWAEEKEPTQLDEPVEVNDIYELTEEDYMVIQTFNDNNIKFEDDNINDDDDDDINIPYDDDMKSEIKKQTGKQWNFKIQNYLNVWNNSNLISKFRIRYYW